MFRSEINWGEIVKDKRFKGMTTYFLHKKLNVLVGNVNKANPGSELDDITIEVLRQYLDERAQNLRKD